MTTTDRILDYIKRKDFNGLYEELKDSNSLLVFSNLIVRLKNSAEILKELAKFK